MIDLPTPDNAVPEGLPTDIERFTKRDILAGLPDFVKHPKNFMTIQKALIETLSCGKIHSDPSKMFDCKKCAENVQIRRKLMKRFGFKSAGQYLAWRKTHEEIQRRVPLEMYNKLVEEK